MKMLKKVLAIMMMVACVLLGLTGCESKSEKPPVQQTVTEEKTPEKETTDEHPAGEHPKGEHPTGEHPK